LGKSKVRDGKGVEMGKSPRGPSDGGVPNTGKGREKQENGGDKRRIAKIGVRP